MTVREHDATALDVLVNIDVDDLERATEFYCAAFGLSVGRRLGGGGTELLGATSVIYLLPKEPGTRASATAAQRRDYSRHWTPVHLDFVVPDIEQAVRRACDAGATLESEIRTHAWGRIALFADPFGNGFCLLQFLGRGYDEIATSGS
jgi:predicted enzyme related to lactoylglutathione lyase